MTIMVMGATHAAAGVGGRNNGFLIEPNSVTIDAQGSGVQVGYRFSSTGPYYEDRDEIETDLGDWHIDAPTPPSGVEIRLTVTSGDDPTSGPAVDTWHDLTSPYSGSREWLYTGPPVISGTWLIEIRDSGGVIRTSASYNVEITNSGPP